MGHSFSALPSRCPGGIDHRAPLNRPMTKHAPQSDHAFHAAAVDQVASAMGVDPRHGLDEDGVERRRREHGPNRLPRHRRAPAWRLLLRQFRNVVVYILAAAAVLAAATAHWPETAAVIAVILVNTLIGFVSEWRARRSMDALREMQRQDARVRRNGKERVINAGKLVPGDIVLLEDGDAAPADLRLIEANALRIDESMLTGESAPVQKQTDAVDEQAPLAERASIAYRGTVVTTGSAEGFVIATGGATQLGRIAHLAETAQDPRSPLQDRLNRLGGRLAWITLCVAALVAAAGLYAGQPTELMIETAIALGVAAIPEGLPIVATIALAHGMWKMARRNAIINRLPAVETLGSTSIIFTDKTGTVTDNQMRLERVVTRDGETNLDSGTADCRDRPVLHRLIEVGVLCNNASLRDEDNDGEPEEQLGDPTELALLQAGFDCGIHREPLLRDKPEQREIAFDPERMRMATIHTSPDGGFEVAVKGAPDAVLGCCTRVATCAGDEQLGDAERRAWADKAQQLASQGLRVLTLADRQASDEPDEPYEGLRLLGHVGLLDPPRADVSDAIGRCREAGIRVVMVTGDQPATADAIARQVGIIRDRDHESRVITGKDLESEGDAGHKPDSMMTADVFARVSPAQKLRLIERFQDEGHIIAMTGDGINDTPALEQAEIGVAMGQRGTDAARQASDMVLKDDAFDTIVAAVHRGRVIVDNIRRASIYMLCTNGAEVLAVAAASAAGLPPPLRPLQILYLNVITDVFPALALSVGAGGPGVMQRPPRQRSETILAPRHWWLTALWSVVIGVMVLAALLIARSWLGLNTLDAVTASFLTLGFAKLAFVFNLRPRGSGLLNNDIVRNPWLWPAIGLCIALLLASVYTPGLTSLLETQAPGSMAWLLILSVAACVLLIGQASLLVLDFNARQVKDKANRVSPRARAAGQS